MLRLIEKYKKNKKIDTSSWDKLKELKNRLTWHIQKEKYQRQEEIKEELTTKLQLKQLSYVLKLENHIYIIMHMNMKGKIYYRGKLFSE